jgi:G:T/U-mismatch repair DNA glycosylase|tara:strand:+ start:1122 stop:1766 length:645 start_codon:yes stop_codon:yes gene_type:complete
MTIHPWLSEYPIHDNSKYLILGTHPPMPYYGKLQFYYGNMSEFWRFLDLVYPGNKLYGNGCPKIEEIIKFLDNTKISITDLVYKTKSEKFSKDKDMGRLNPEDLNPYLSEWLKESKIEIIYFTSFGGKNSAKNLFKKWYKNEFKNLCKISNEHVNYIEIFDRKIKLIDLFSPSPTARISSSRIKEYMEWKMRSEVNNDYDAFRVYWYKKHLPKK